MVRRAPGASDAKVYDVSSRTPVSLHANLNLGLRTESTKERARRKLELQNTDTQLIQDFEFPTVSHRIKVSRNGRYIFASGTYPPQLHVYDTEQLSLKFKRHVDLEIVDFQILDDDWRKFVLLSADRYIDFHSPFGSHYKTRVPSCGRDLMINRGTSDLFICGQGPQVWRFNLDQGRFLAPLSTRSGSPSGNNVCAISPVNSLLAFGGDTGLLDIYDPRIIGRNQRPVATLDVAALVPKFGARSLEVSELTAVRFNDYDGVSLATGTSCGHSLLFDLRSSHPVLTREHGNGLPIRSFRFHDNRKHCISADVKSVKVWPKRGGSNSAVVETNADLNHLCVVGASGVMCTALETKHVQSFYIPALGSAPKWCSFLDTFTEELEDGRDVRSASKSQTYDGGQAEDETVYENYKFVTKDELDSLGLAHLVGSDVLKAYMHGYFMHQKLYRRAVDVTEPFAYEKYRKQKAREKIEELRQSRISKVRTGKSKHSKVIVNQKTVDHLQERQKSGKRRSKNALSVLDDERFSAMFSNKDFAVDEEAERFQFLNPKGTSHRKDIKRSEADGSDEEYLERFDLVDDGGTESASRKDNAGEALWSSDEEDGEDNEDGIDSDNDNGSGDNSIMTSQKKRITKQAAHAKVKRKSKVTKMYEIEKESDMMGKVGLGLNGLSAASASRKVREKVTLGERLQTLGENEANKRTAVKTNDR